MTDKTPQPREVFPATQWTLVQQVREGGSSARGAIEEICRRYWFPIYSFLRRSGRTHEDAEDFTQGFFATLLADESLLRANPERGRLRTFLLTVLRDYLADATRHASRQKRGGGIQHVPLDFSEAATRYAAEPIDHRDPETLYHLAWSRGLLERARQRLRESFAAAGKGDFLAAIEPHLEGDAAALPYAQLAPALGFTETALRLAVFRARQKLRSLVEEEIASTVTTREETEEELRFLSATLASK